MKHLLDIKYFLTEALTPFHNETYEYHKGQRTQEVQDRLNSLLGQDERIYIPFVSGNDSKVFTQVSDFLKSKGYEIFDYKQNLAFKPENPKRKVRISTLLSKEPSLLRVFLLDETRANSRNKQNEYSIVITSYYEDVAGMSTGRDWDSCMRLPYEDDEDDEGGCNYEFLASDVEEGTIIAYLIYSHDTEIEEPLGRVAIKPYTRIDDKKDVIYIPDVKIYGNIPSATEFLKIVKSWFIEKQKDIKTGWYLKNEQLYSDLGSPQQVLIKKDYTLCYDCDYDEDGYNRFGYDMDGYDRDGYNNRGRHKDGNNILTQEQYDFLDRSTLRSNGIKIVNRDGEIVIDVDGGTVDIRYGYVKDGKIPVQFGNVTGFMLSGRDVTTLEGVPYYVDQYITIDDTSITNLEGFPLYCKGFDIKNNHQLKTTKGFKPQSKFELYTCKFENNAIEEIVDLDGSGFSGTLSFRGNKLTSLKGLENIKATTLNCCVNLIDDLSDCPKGLTYLKVMTNNLDSLDSLKVMVPSVAASNQRTRKVFPIGKDHGHPFIGTINSE